MTTSETRLSNARDILRGSATRSIYDVFAFARTRNSDNLQPAVTYTMSRDRDEADLAPGQEPEIYHAFHYSDGLGRLIQSKQQNQAWARCVAWARRPHHSRPGRAASAHRDTGESSLGVIWLGHLQ